MPSPQYFLRHFVPFTGYPRGTIVIDSKRRRPTGSSQTRCHIPVVQK